MKRFLSANPGMQRRIAHKFSFQDYTSDHLTEICSRMAAKRKLELGPGVPQLLPQLFETHFPPHVRSQWNGGLAARVVSESFQCLNARLDPDTATREDLVTLTAVDISNGFAAAREAVCALQANDDSAPPGNPVPPPLPPPGSGPPPPQYTPAPHQPYPLNVQTHASPPAGGCCGCATHRVGDWLPPGHPVTFGPILSFTVGEKVAVRRSNGRLSFGCVKVLDSSSIVVGVDQGNNQKTFPLPEACTFVGRIPPLTTEVIHNFATMAVGPATSTAPGGVPPVLYEGYAPAYAPPPANYAAPGPGLGFR
eukprot:CAMPEP_0114567778 /NCGR_PEP_ID=MMETSP0114-20121206/15676_1 /TAXON_ID=31324 /ORGANISM="Goniomonas sp, Strain m" /LENGTH=307 /DNA_ID=CAMNT_0001754417 /DNA_START=233 /DNA_END=1153 /DNA_ORIENTATION=+